MDLCAQGVSRPPNTLAKGYSLFYCSTFPIERMGQQKDRLWTSSPNALNLKFEKYSVVLIVAMIWKRKSNQLLIASVQRKDLTLSNGSL